MKTFVERFSSLLHPGETQKEFAERLGVTQSSVSRYLRGRPPGRESLQKIVAVTGVSSDWLVAGKEREIAPEVSSIIRKVGVRMTRPAEDKDWLQILLFYFDEVKFLAQEEKEYIKNIILDYVNEPDRRIELIHYWNYLRFREKNPTERPPKRKRRKKR